MIVLLCLLPFLTIAIIPNQQIFNAYLVWAQDHADLMFFGQKMPTTWLITLDSIVSVSFLFIAVIFWRVWSKKFPEPAEITKIAIGSVIAVTGMLSLIVGATIAAKTGTKVAIGWLIAFHVLNSAGFANVFPVSLALYARVAPAALSATIIGFIIWHSSPATIWSAGSVAFWRKWRRHSFGCCTRSLAGVAGVTFFLAGQLVSALACANR